MPDTDSNRANGKDREGPRRFPQKIWLGPARLTWVELLAVIGGLAVFGDVGWDGPLWDGRLEMILHLIGGVALLAGLIGILRGAGYPRTGLEVPVLAFLVALGLATLLGQNHGLAARAMAATVAFAGLLPLSILAVTRRPQLTALVTLVPTLVLAVTILWQLVARRIGWFSLGLGGLPPVRLPGESTAFGSVVVPPFILLGLLPLCLLVRPRGLRLVLIGITLALLLPLAALSGSRSAWLALAVAVVVFAAPNARRLTGLRLPRPRPSAVLAGALAVIVLLIAVAFVSPRFTAITSLVYRERLWADTLKAWSVSPITGIGPGTMPYARQAAAPPELGPIRQPHSHDLALGVLGDAGLLGLMAAVTIVVLFFWFAGPHRSRTSSGRAASSVLAGFLVAGFVEDLTFLPAFDVIVILLAAVSLIDAGAVSWTRVRLPRWSPVIAGLGAAALLVPVLLGDIASVTYRLGAEDVWAGRWRSAEGWYQASMAFDPSQPSGPKALTIAADMVGDRDEAIAAARAATSLNPADGPSWTNLALLCADAGDRDCALSASEKAARWSPVGYRELINAALVEARFGNTGEADKLYRSSLITYPYTSLSVHWPRPISVDPGSVRAITPLTQLAVVLGLASEGEPVVAPPASDPAVIALAAALRNDRSAAVAALQDAEQREPYEPLTWQVAAVLETHWGDDARQALAVAAFLQNSPLSFVGASGPPPVTYEIGSLHIIPRDELVRDAQRLMPAPPWPWALERFLPPNG